MISILTMNYKFPRPAVLFRESRARSLFCKHESRGVYIQRFFSFGRACAICIFSRQLRWLDTFPLVRSMFDALGFRVVIRDRQIGNLTRPSNRKSRATFKSGIPRDLQIGNPARPSHRESRATVKSGILRGRQITKLRRY